MKTPTIKEINTLLAYLKPHICDDYRASDDPDDNKPGMQVTIGANSYGGWNYQTGDNSYFGTAYSYPYWAVVSLYRDSNCHELAKDCVAQIAGSE